MKLEDMKTTADALRWALHRLETAGTDCGDYFAKADAILAQPMESADHLRKLQEIVDVYDDGLRPYEERAYVGGTFQMCIEEARALIAKHKEQM